MTRYSFKRRISPIVTRWSLIALLLGLVVQLAACGFQPRGTSAGRLDAVPGPLFVAGIGPYSPLYRELRQQLAHSDLELVSNAADSGSTLRITDWKRGHRVLSVDSRNRAVEFELEDRLRFALHDKAGRQLLPPQSERVIRIQFRPPTLILGSARESELLREDMLRDLVGRVVRRLSRLN